MVNIAGEWCGDWDVVNGTEKEIKEFIAAQVNVYDNATFGWTLWTLKNVQNLWSFQWLIENGYLKI